MEGWIKLHRKICESNIFANPNLLKVWMWCLIKASHSETEFLIGFQSVKLLPGQFIFGRKSAAEELKMSESSVYKYIKFLEKKENQIKIESNNKFSIVTIVNWDLYQSDNKDNDNNITTEEQQENNNITTREQQNNTNKNVKNVKNINNNIYSQNEPGVSDEKTTTVKSNNNYTQSELDILDLWNSKCIVVHSLDKLDLQKSIKSALVKYTSEQIKQAIDRYAEVYKSDYYYSHTWNLDKFCKQSNGIPNFLDDGQIWLNYIKSKEKGFKQETKAKTNKFNNFNQRTYDYNDLEKKLREKRAK